MYVRLHIKPLYARNSSTPRLCGAPIHRHKIEMVQRKAIRWTLDNYYSYDSVSQMQTNLGWRSLDQRRADARLCMLYTTAHGRIAIQQPSIALRQIHTSVTFYKYSFFPWLLCNGTSYQPMLLCCLHGSIQRGSQVSWPQVTLVTTDLF